MKKLGNLPSWDLTDFYKSIADKKIAEDFKLARDLAACFKKKLSGKISRNFCD